MAPKRLFRRRVWESVQKRLGIEVDYLNFIGVRRENLYDLRWKGYYDDASSFFDGDYDIGRENEFQHEHSSLHWFWQAYDGDLTPQTIIGSIPKISYKKYFRPAAIGKHETGYIFVTKTQFNPLLIHFFLDRFFGFKLTDDKSDILSDVFNCFKVFFALNFLIFPEAYISMRKSFNIIKQIKIRRVSQEFQNEIRIAWNILNFIYKSSIYR